jgi:metal-responsive CopG/Arc/MetJ family transcriptional regulator
METIQVVLDTPLLKAADKAARRFKVNRSALVRDALRAHLSALANRDREAADRRGYELIPDEVDSPWLALASWPDE